jgi:ABC-type multidrug transport system fused ATPase/permease subunit
MLAYIYPLGGVFVSMLYFFLFFIWIWLLFTVFFDIFRSDDLSGWIKALWVIFVIILPYLGVFVYLIARGGKMHERKLQEAAQQKTAFDQYVKEAAGTTGGDVASELTKLADLKSQGVLTDAEFDAQKAKLLGTS